jgi:hypothetical protein
MLARLYLSADNCGLAQQNQALANQAYETFLAINKDYKDEPLSESLENLEVAISDACTFG